jgi:hypothetical protein
MELPTEVASNLARYMSECISIPASGVWKEVCDGTGVTDKWHSNQDVGYEEGSIELASGRLNFLAVIGAGPDADNKQIGAYFRTFDGFGSAIELISGM